jgi:hypothetical protein
MVTLAHMHLADQADEHGKAADSLVAIGEVAELGADVEIGFLDAHAHGVSRR